MSLSLAILPFLDMLYDYIRLPARTTCRVPGVERMLGESQLFLFDLNTAESCGLAGENEKRERVFVHE